MKKSHIIFIIITILIAMFMILDMITAPNDISKKALLKAAKDKDTAKLKKIIRHRAKNKGGRKYRNDTGYSTTNHRG